MPKQPWNKTAVAFWALFLAGFAVVGGVQFRQARTALSVHDTGPSCCTDAVWQSVARVPGASERISEILRQSPTPGGIVLLHPNPPNSHGFMHQLLGYLGWPRPVLKKAVLPANLPEEIERLRKLQIGMLVLADLEPPDSLPRTERLGLRLVFVPLTAPAP